MSPPDAYTDIAERYARMLQNDPERESFLRSTFEKHHVRTVLDCACGTGNDLLLFRSFGLDVVGSDVSESMLKVARRAIDRSQAEIVLRKADFHDLRASHPETFDAIVCLSNSINEGDTDAVRALQSMKAVLRPSGVIVFDQGQTDKMMEDPPSYAPILNDPDLSRLFTMTYDKSIMTVNIFDFIHDSESSRYEFAYNRFRIQIRLYAEWTSIMEKVDLKAEFYGSWRGEAYDPKKSQRLVVVSTK